MKNMTGNPVLSGNVMTAYFNHLTLVSCFFQQFPASCVHEGLSGVRRTSRYFEQSLVLPESIHLHEQHVFSFIECNDTY